MRTGLRDLGDTLATNDQQTLCVGRQHSLH